MSSWLAVVVLVEVWLGWSAVFHVQTSELVDEVCLCVADSALEPCVRTEHCAGPPALERLGESIGLAEPGSRLTIAARFERVPGCVWAQARRGELWSPRSSEVVQPIALDLSLDGALTGADSTLLSRWLLELEPVWGRCDT